MNHEPKPKRIVVIRPHGRAETWVVDIEWTDGRIDREGFENQDHATLRASRLADEHRLSVLFC